MYPLSNIFPELVDFFPARAGDAKGNDALTIHSVFTFTGNSQKVGFSGGRLGLYFGNRYYITNL